MRVVHLTPALFGAGGIVGGAERYAYELARHMAEEVPTRLVAFGERTSDTESGALRVHVIGRPWYVRGQRQNPIAIRLLRHLSEADVVHCHQRAVLVSSVAAIFCRATRRRVFVTDHGGGGWDVSAFIATDGWYDGHLHISDYSRDAHGHRGKASAHVIRAGIDTQRFSPADGVPRDGGILFVGRILPHKGIDVLLDALPAEASLQVVGREFDQRYLDDLRRLALGKAVSFWFDCDDADLVDVYRRATCVVLPSVNRTMYGDDVKSAELLGQSLIEAMACGALAICTAVGGMPEIVEDGVTGFIVAPGDSVALRERLGWVRLHPEQAARIAAAGRRAVREKFSWPRVVGRCLEIYRAAA
jgi:glycosyltransferase involved in cell wall biosynthesis